MRVIITPNDIRSKLESLGRIRTKQAIRESTLSPKEIKSLAGLYPKWRTGLSVIVDDLYRYQGELYKVVQAHTTQSDWYPPVVPALWVSVSAPGVVAQWVQPTGAQDAYARGDKVTHDNPNDSGNIWLYLSTIAANTTEPSRDSTFDRYWTPLKQV